MEETNETSKSNLETFKEVAEIVTVTATAIVAAKKLYDLGSETIKEIKKRRSEKETVES